MCETRLQPQDGLKRNAIYLITIIVQIQKNISVDKHLQHIAFICHESYNSYYNSLFVNLHSS